MTAAINRVPTPAGLLAAQARSWADHPLFILPQAVAELWQAPAWISYAQAQAQVEALRASYAAAGYGPGARVALLLENRPDHFLHWLALNGLGASVVPLNPDASREELGWLLAHSGAALIVALPHRCGQVEGLGAAVISSDAPHPRHLFENIPGRVPAGDWGQRPPDADAECALIYTSGTTGRPKGCILSNRHFISWGRWYLRQGGHVALRQGTERLITPLPTFHVNAMGNSFMGMLAAGGAQVIVDRFHPQTWWDMVRETAATCCHYLGVMPAILLAMPETAQDRDHGLRFGLGGGVHPDHHAAFEARFGFPLLEGWAMTETGGTCLLCATDEPRHVGTRCIGRPGAGMEVRIDPATGEFLVRAAGADPRQGLFSGYLDDPEATEAAWAGGWFHTGDIITAGCDGSLHFTDRLKNIIRRSGENIAALEVESALASHPEVAQVAVIAVADLLRGEEVLAAVIPRTPPGDAVLAARLQAHVAAQLAYYKVPGFIAFLDALPVTSTQKVRKAGFGALATAPGSQPNCHDLRSGKQALRPKSGVSG